MLQSANLIVQNEVNLTYEHAFKTIFCGVKRKRSRESKKRGTEKEVRDGRRKEGRELETIGKQD